MEYNIKRFSNRIRIEREKGNKNNFFAFFDGGRTVDGAFLRASNCFKSMMLPHAKKYFTDLTDKTSLDIGYGSGGQVLEASKYFKMAYGIDVHTECDYVGAELKQKGCNNFCFLECNGTSIPVDNTSIDFIHSFVTFLHVGKIQVVVDYLLEIKRVLKPNGIAVLFFSRILRTGGRVQPYDKYLLDVAQEEKSGLTYREADSTPMSMGIWCMNLTIAMHYMKSIVIKADLVVVDQGGVSSEKDGVKFFGGQHFVVLKKI